MGQNKYILIGCALVCFGLLAACGSDDNEATPAAGQGGEGGDGASGVGGSGGTSGAGGGDTVAPLPADTAGKPCTGDTECDRGTCATMVGGLDGMPIAAPGGYCMATCTASAECGAGGTCVPDVSGSGLCYEACMAATDCREGYVCGPLTSTCRPAPPTDQLADNVAGIACAGDTDCGDGLCLTERLNRMPYPGGYCSGACLEDAHCGAGGVCLGFGAGAGRCYDTCATDPDCARDGYRCRMLSDTAMGCLPASDPLPDNIAGSACADDTQCGGVMGACVTMLPAAGGGEVEAPAGYCSNSCEIDADCGAGGACVTTRQASICFKSCANADECRSPYECVPRGFNDPQPTVCAPPEPDGGVEMPDASVADGGM